MSTQPESLQLAEWLEEQYDPTGNQDRAAAELRRLHNELEREKVSRQAAQAENEDLKARLARAGLERQQAVLTKDALLRQALEAMETHVPYYLKDRGHPVITAIRQHLEGKQ